MQLITSLTDDPSQSLGITLDDGSIVQMSLTFVPAQQGWFYSITYGTFQVNNMRIVNSPNMLRRFRNIIPFGLAVTVIDGYEIIYQSDWVSGRSEPFFIKSNRCTTGRDIDNEDPAGIYWGFYKLMGFTPTTVTPKFQRTYTVQVEAINGSTFTFGSPDGSSPLLTMEFNIIRNILSSVQTGNFRIRNINQNTRNNIFKDYFNIATWRSVVVKAGYVGTPLSTIFNGKANTIYSYRETGGTDWITEIEGTDFSGLFSNSWSSWTDNPGTGQNYTQKNVISHLITDLQASAQSYGQTLGIGVVNGFTTPRYSFTANDFTMNLLAIESGRLVYIDNGQIFVMPSNYTFAGDVTLISSATGLLGTPKQQQSNLIVQMMFEPGLVPGQQVELDTEASEFSSAKNGLYKVVGVQHAGVISSTIDRGVITTVTLQYVNNIQQAPFGIYAGV